MFKIHLLLLDLDQESAAVNQGWNTNLCSLPKHIYYEGGKTYPPSVFSYWQTSAISDFSRAFRTGGYFLVNGTTPSTDKFPACDEQFTGESAMNLRLGERDGRLALMHPWQLCSRIEDLHWTTRQDKSWGNWPHQWLQASEMESKSRVRQAALRGKTLGLSTSIAAKSMVDCLGLRMRTVRSGSAGHCNFWMGTSYARLPFSPTSCFKVSSSGRSPLSRASCIHKTSCVYEDGHRRKTEGLIVRWSFIYPKKRNQALPTSKLLEAGLDAAERIWRANLAYFASEEIIHKAGTSQQHSNLVILYASPLKWTSIISIDSLLQAIAYLPDNQPSGALCYSFFWISSSQWPTADVCNSLIMQKGRILRTPSVHVKSQSGNPLSEICVHDDWR